MFAVSEGQSPSRLPRCSSRRRRLANHIVTTHRKQENRKWDWAMKPQGLLPLPILARLRFLKGSQPPQTTPSAEEQGFKLTSLQGIFLI